MRHFSTESTGMRLLMEDELEAVSGGDADDGDDESGGGIGAIFITPPPIFIDVPAPSYESQLDAQALQAVSILKNSPTYERFESGIFIIDKGFGPQLTQVFTTSESDRINFGTLTPAALGADSFSQVKGFIHNHPEGQDSSTVIGDVNNLNRRPSTADYDLGDQIAAIGGNQQIFRLYVIGPDDVTRQYDLTDPRNVTSTDVLR